MKYTRAEPKSQKSGNGGDSKITTDQIIEIFGATPETTPQFRKKYFFHKKNEIHFSSYQNDFINFLIKLNIFLMHHHAERDAGDSLARDKNLAIILMHYKSFCQKIKLISMN